MKKFFALVISLIMALSFAGCTARDALSEEKQNSSIGKVISAEGVGDFTIKKIYTTPVVYSINRRGTFFECENKDNVYVDVILAFKSKKQEVSLMNTCSLKAMGKDTGKEFAESLTFMEKDGEIGLCTTETVVPLAETTVHITVEVPENGADDIYKMTLSIGDEQYEFDYKKGDFLSDAQTIYEGQSVSDAKAKITLDSCLYSLNTYERAPHVCDAPKGSIYLVARFKVMNKTFEEEDFREFLSAYAVYEDAVFEANYLYSEEKTDGYASEGTMPGISEGYIIAFASVDEEYTEQKGSFVFALNGQEYYTKLFPTESVSRMSGGRDVEEKVPVVQEKPAENEDSEKADAEKTSDEVQTPDDKTDTEKESEEPDDAENTQSSNGQETTSSLPQESAEEPFAGAVGESDLKGENDTQKADAPAEDASLENVISE